MTKKPKDQTNKKTHCGLWITIVVCSAMNEQYFSHSL
jgi:hypothetical protein